MKYKGDPLLAVLEAKKKVRAVHVKGLDRTIRLAESGFRRTHDLEIYDLIGRLQTKREQLVGKKLRAYSGQRKLW